MTLQELIARCLAEKQGSKEFCLYYFDYGDNARRWRAEIGNPSDWVVIGETEGEYRAEGETPEAAVAALLDDVRAGRKY